MDLSFLVDQMPYDNHCSPKEVSYTYHGLIGIVIIKPTNRIDNNHLDDIELYQGMKWLERKHIVGKVVGYAFPL